MNPLNVEKRINKQLTDEQAGMPITVEVTPSYVRSILAEKVIRPCHVLLLSCMAHHWIYWAGLFFGMLPAVACDNSLKITEYKIANSSQDDDFEKDAK